MLPLGAMIDDVSVRGRSWIAAFGRRLKIAILALCGFATLLFAAFAWWDIHNRRLPYDLDIDTAPAEEAAVDPASIEGAVAKEPPVDPQPVEAQRAPPLANPPAAIVGVDAELAARRLSIPVAGVAPEALRDSFDETRGGSRQHLAIDILAPRHAKVLAVEDGTIAKLFASRFGGITVYQFDPGGRYCYYYAHLQGYAPGVREGKAVRRGDTLGFVGTSGNAPADAPHLHFQIYRLTAERHWWEGEPVNPYPYLRVESGP